MFEFHEAVLLWFLVKGKLVATDREPMTTSSSGRVIGYSRPALARAQTLPPLRGFGSQLVTRSKVERLYSPSLSLSMACRFCFISSVRFATIFSMNESSTKLLHSEIMAAL